MEPIKISNSCINCKNVTNENNCTVHNLVVSASNTCESFNLDEGISQVNIQNKYLKADSKQ